MTRDEWLKIRERYSDPQPSLETLTVLLLVEIVEQLWKLRMELDKT